MKKILLVLTVLLILVLASCTQTYQDKDLTCPLAGENWEIICKHTSANSNSVYYLEDKTTGLIYFIACGYEACSVYYNKDGKPMTRTEFDRVHVLAYHDED